VSQPALLRLAVGASRRIAGEAAGVRLVPLPEAHALTDLDTASDWARWRGGHRPG
jgi:molybdenum cofactor cytidylyltransferase